MNDLSCHEKRFFAAKVFYFRKRRSLRGVKLVFALPKRLSRLMNGSFCFEDSFLSCETFCLAKARSSRDLKLVYVRENWLCGEINDLFRGETLWFLKAMSFRVAKLVSSSENEFHSK
jgi:hypothetical protein